MKKCLECANTFAREEDRCPACGWAPSLVHQFPAYAPELAQENSGFKAGYFSRLAELEAGNFWFRGRNRLILWALEKYSRKLDSFLEIGCGTGFVLSGVARQYPDAKLYGSEIFSAGLGFAAERTPSVNFMQMDARHVPFIDEFDAIGAFDVLEHINEDEQVLSMLHQAVKPGGLLVLTVPQHAWLWSPTDDYACHVRRYSAKELHAKVQAAGFNVERSTSFVSALLPAMLASRAMQKRSPRRIEENPTAELELSPWLNGALESVLNAEVAMIRSGVNLPVGGSRLLIARKPG
ncbi:class I SAM-dependent methyltransferase [Cupriavidus pauculus]|uniref:SAM-dependent methyltransferase n=1 Tax=Cupriavidus pauculus TaxID=82633 RepID=A0A2N5CH56_9BURK|nr:class I SAM-dependent methyltransferase [Cupriavidus pauculus]PLQ01534.1 SAM-dependent methyltransferase [Cupriavidus pauculus]